MHEFGRPAGLNKPEPERHLWKTGRRGQQASTPCSRAAAPLRFSSLALIELIQEVEARTRRAPSARYDALARNLPIVHRTMNPGRLLDGSPLQPGVGSNTREQLGVGGHTFFWIGNCAYDEWDLALLWEASAENTEPPGIAAPWDTGGLCKGSLGEAIKVEVARSILARYSLSSPEYRTYLAAVIECCFDDPSQYLRPDYRTIPWYPGWRATPRCGSPPHRTFELRRSGDVEVAASLVALVAAEGAFANEPRVLRGLKGLANMLDARWVRVEAEHGERPHEAMQRLIRTYLHELDLV